MCDLILSTFNLKLFPKLRIDVNFDLLFHVKNSNIVLEFDQGDANIMKKNGKTGNRETLNETSRLRSKVPQRA